MAQGRSARSKGVPHHPLVEALASDPSSPPQRATKLFGFPGPAADAKATRLWLDLDLTGYVDVPDDAILHSQTLENEEGTYLWVDPTATLTHSGAQSHEVQAEFLGGSIAERNLGGAAPAAGPGIYPTLATTGCRVPSIDICTVVPELCGHQIVSARTACPTVAPVCGHLRSAATHCPTVEPMCHRRVSVATRCPTVEPLCNPMLSAATRCPTVEPTCGPVPSVAIHCMSFGRCPSVVDVCTSWGCGDTMVCNDPVGPFKPFEG
jgi:hypothetical protein